MRDGVSLLKFPYVMDERTLEDDMFASTTAADFYDAMRKGAAPTTSQLAMTSLMAAFEAAAMDGTPCVYLSFTSGLSGSFDIAQMVRDQVVERHPGFQLFVVDTLLPSIAEGVLVIEALNQMEKGLTAKELVAWAEEARFFVDCEFMVEDLETLRRGGRIPATAAVAGSALDVKPLLSVDCEGALKLVGVARGRKKGIKQLAEYYLKNVENTHGRYAVVGDADCPKDAARLKDMLLKDDAGALVIDASIGPVIGSHVGPSMLAVAFWGSDKRENLSVAERIAKRVRRTDE